MNTQNTVSSSTVSPVTINTALADNLNKIVTPPPVTSQVSNSPTSDKSNKGKVSGKAKEMLSPTGLRSLIADRATKLVRQNKFSRAKVLSELYTMLEAKNAKLTDSIKKVCYFELDRALTAYQKQWKELSASIRFGVSEFHAGQITQFRASKSVLIRELTPNEQINGAIDMLVQARARFAKGQFKDWHKARSKVVNARNNLLIALHNHKTSIHKEVAEHAAKMVDMPIPDTVPLTVSEAIQAKKNK